MNNLPITVKRSIELLGLVLMFTVFYIGQDIIMPLLMAFFISLMLLPIYRFLRKIKFPEIVAIIVAIFCALLIILTIAGFLSWQVGLLVQDFPQLKQNFESHWDNLSSWIQQKFNISSTDQSEMLKEQSKKLFDSAGTVLSGAMVSITGIFVFIGLIPIYTFLILFYKNLILRFVFLWFNRDDHENVESVLRESEVMIKSYLIGLLIQVTYMTLLLGGILLVIGVKHALLIAILFAVLNLIPYVGALVGNILGVLITLSSSNELWHVVAVLIAITVVQFLDNNILMPKIVGSKIKINALVSIIGVVIGGSLAGISGMFLSLPIIAVIKIIFDRTNEFHHWGMLLGDEKPALSPMSNYVLRLRNRHIRKKGNDDEID